MGKLFRKLTVTAALMLSVACTVGQTQVPGVAGPSELALSIQLNAIPDSISQDGASQSSIALAAFDANGKPIAGLPVRLDMAVGGIAQDFGRLSARTIVTGTDGKATAIYTAPPPPPPTLAGSGTTVTIRATPTGSNYETRNPQFVAIRLVPPGVILPPASTPVAKFTFTPTPVNLNTATTFDASTSCAVSLDTNGNCPPNSSVITSYAWNFGDGGTATGKTATHSFSGLATFNVTLTVTNDRGVSASVSQPVTTAASAAPTADFVFSPVPVLVNGTVTFNANASRAAPGHTIVQYSWDFGDATSGGNAPSVSHIYNAAQTYKVVLTVTDDVGQRGTKQQDVVVLTGNPIPVIVTTLGAATSRTVNFDASNTTTFGGATISSYLWNFGDPLNSTSTVGPRTSFTYTSFIAFTVQLTVTDSLGRSASTTVSVTPP
jgi:PKD repeat protein